jgi:hypothetical protein
MDILQGQKYKWMGAIFEVTRVAKDQSWADIKVSTVSRPDKTWTKRQPLPFPEDCQHIDSSTS